MDNGIKWKKRKRDLLAKWFFRQEFWDRNGKDIYFWYESILYNKHKQI